MKLEAGQDVATQSLILARQNELIKTRMEYAALDADEKLRLAERGVYNERDYVRSKR